MQSAGTPAVTPRCGRESSFLLGRGKYSVCFKEVVSQIDKRPQAKQFDVLSRCRLEVTFGTADLGIAAPATLITRELVVKTQ
jgi:hypothetical protein